MAELQALLKAKQQELDVLQQSYDDYIESSKELEAELEGALQHAEAQISDCTKRKAALEEKLGSLQEKHSKLTREYAQLQSDYTKTKEKLEIVEQLKVSLEQSNDDNLEKLRISLATEDDLRDKLNRAEEEAIFLQSDMEDLRKEKLDAERRLKTELTELQAELAKIDNANTVQETAADADGKAAATATATGSKARADQTEIIEELELEVADLTSRLSEADEQSKALSEELERVQEDIMRAHAAGDAKAAAILLETRGRIQSLEKEVESLTEKLLSKDAELQALNKEQRRRFEGETENTSLFERLTGELSSKSAELESVRLTLADTEADLHVKEQVIAGLEKRIEKIESQREEAERGRTELSLALEDMKQKEAGRRERYVLEQERIKLQEESTAILPPEPPVISQEEPLDQLCTSDALATSQESVRVGSAEAEYVGPLPEPALSVIVSKEVLEGILVSSDEGSVEQLSNFDQEMRNWESERLMLLRRINELTQELHLRHHSPRGIRSDDSDEGTSPYNTVYPKGAQAVPTLVPSASSSSSVPEAVTICDKSEVTAEEESLRALSLIDASTAQLAVKRALSSQDVTTMKSELIRQMERLEKMRFSNASLLQKLQALKGNIQVCCRCRPMNEAEISTGTVVCVEAVDDCELAFNDKRYGAWRSFAFDKVWGADATQAEVFSDVEPMALSVVDGYNACILAYGQTGSGKTYTMNGYGRDFGVDYRTLNKIFELLNMRRAQAERLAVKVQSSGGGKRAKPLVVATPASIAASVVEDDSQASMPSETKTVDVDDGEEKDKSTVIESGIDGPSDGAAVDAEEDPDSCPLPFTFTVEVSMLEIYNEQIKDLLNPSDNPNNSLEARQTQEGTVYVPGLTQEAVSSLEEVMKVFARGSQNRATASTNLNEHSSRSHSLLMVTVSTCTNGGPPSKGKLSLVDLAGSERVEKSGVTGTNMKEAQYINKSLASLGDVMEALDSRSKHVPFRNSKLTYLLQDSLGGNSRTMMIVTVCPTDLSVDETLFTLQFATRVRRINLGAARRNVTAKNLEEALKAAKLELKDTKKRKAQLEETLSEMKRDQKRSQEKITAQMDARVRSIDEVRKGVESQIQTLQRTNADLTSKLLEERETRAQQSVEIEALQRNVKKAQELLRVATKEKEELIFAAKQKQREYDAMRTHVREMEREKEKEREKEREREKRKPSSTVVPVKITKSASRSNSGRKAEGVTDGEVDSAANSTNRGGRSSALSQRTEGGVSSSSSRPTAPLPRPRSASKREPERSSREYYDMLDTVDDFIVTDDSDADEVYQLIESMTAASSALSAARLLSTSSVSTVCASPGNINISSSSNNNSNSHVSGGAGVGGGVGVASTVSMTRAEAAIIRHQDRMKKKLDQRK